MGRFDNGNDPGNGRGKQGKGDFVATEFGDHILGTKGDDDGSTGDAIPILSDVIGLDAGDILIDLKGGDDLFNGFAGDDKAYGGDGNDNLNGQEGDDLLAGGAGDDNISGGDGDDALYGGDDDDTIEGGAGADHIDGGDGNDTASYEDAPEDGPLVTDFGTFNGVAVSLETDRANNSDATGDELDNIENLVGSDFDDFLQGDAEANILMGGDGDDTIDGGAGDDTIVGGNGDDDLTGGADSDTFVYNTVAEGGDTINDFSGFGGEGDTIDLTALGLDDIAAGNGEDAIADGYVFLVGNSLYVDIDGGGVGDGTGDDFLIANLNTAISLGDDVLL